MSERKATSRTLPTPSHYNVKHAFTAAHAVGDVGALQVAAESWRTQHDIKPVGGDRVRVHLLIIDDQYDFTFPEGALFVGGRSGKGAMTAQDRLCRFIYGNLDRLTQITTTMDTHLPFQIFFPSAHLDQSGRHPAPHTMISAADYRSGRFRPNPAMARQLGVDPVWLERQFVHYCEKLEERGKYQLYLWPYHCLLGTNGHRLAGVIDEARRDIG